MLCAKTSDDRVIYDNIANVWKSLSPGQTLTMTTLRVEKFARALVINAVFRGVEEGTIDGESIIREMKRRVAVTHYRKEGNKEAIHLEAEQFVKQCNQYLQSAISVNGTNG